jgi:DNA mismatch repair protein MutS2
MERKLKQIVLDWKKTDNKEELIRQMHALLFAQKARQQNDRVKKKFDWKYIEIGGDIDIGQKVMMKKNHQVGLVKEIRGKKAVVQVGMVPITVSMQDLTLIKEKEEQEKID